MAQLPERFNNADVPESEFDELPIARYLVQITESEVKENSKNTGTVAALRLVVMDGPCENRIWFENCNIINDNLTAQNMGREMFRNICKACGLEGADDTEELHFIPFFIDVDDRLNKKTGEVRRVIKKCSPYVQSGQHANANARSAQPGPAPRYQDERQQDDGAVNQRQATQQRQAAPQRQSAPPAAQGSRPWPRATR